MTGKIQFTVITFVYQIMVSKQLVQVAKQRDHRHTGDTNNK